MKFKIDLIVWKQDYRDASNWNVSPFKIDLIVWKLDDLLNNFHKELGLKLT